MMRRMKHPGRAERKVREDLASDTPDRDGWPLRPHSGAEGVADRALLVAEAVDNRVVSRSQLC